jgi:hypothetical protein
MDAGGGPIVGSITLPGAEVNTPVTLSNADNTDVEGWRFEILDAPAPSPTLNPLPPPTHSNTAVITPDVKGHTIMVRLTTYRDAGRTQIDDVDQQVIRVRFEPPFDWVIPAAQESIEANEIRGWAEDVNRILRDVHQIIDDGGGGGFMIARLIGDLDKVIAPGLSMLWTPDVDLDPATNLELAPQGDMAGIDHRENFNPEYIPVRQSRTVHTQDVLLVDRIRIRGRLRLLGRLRILPTIDGQYVLDQLTEIAPDAGGILGALSPAKFLTAQETRAFTETLTAAQVTSIAEQVAAEQQDLPLHPDITGNLAGERGGGEVYEVGFLHRMRGGSTPNKFYRLPPGNWNPAPQEGDRIGFIEIEGGTSNSWSMDVNAAQELRALNGVLIYGSSNFSWPGGTLFFKWVNGAWTPCGGSMLHHFLDSNPSNSGWFMEQDPGQRRLIKKFASSNQVYLRDRLNNFLPVTLNTNQMLYRPSSSSLSIQAMTVNSYSLVGRSSTGNIAGIGIGSQSVVVRGSSLQGIPLANDDLVGRVEGSTIQALQPYELRHILGGRIHGGVVATTITSVQASWQPGGSSPGRRGWFYNLTDVTNGEVRGLVVSETTSDQVFEKYFHNADSDPLPWIHEGAAGSTSYRIRCPGNVDYIQQPGETVKLAYDWSANRWYLVAPRVADQLETFLNGSSRIPVTDSSGDLQSLSIAGSSVVGRLGGLLQNITLTTHSLLLRAAGSSMAVTTILDSQFVGRPAGGDLGAMTEAQAKAILGGPAADDFATQADLQAVVSGLDWQDSVLDKDLVTAPAHGAGDRYIVAGLGGAWSGATVGDIAESDGATWSFETPNEGFCATVEDEDKSYIWNGSAWVLLANYTGAIVEAGHGANSVVGRAANSVGPAADIGPAGAGAVLRESGGTLGFGTVAAAGLADEAVTNAKLAHMAENTIKARASAGAGDAEDLSVGAETLVGRRATGQVTQIGGGGGGLLKIIHRDTKFSGGGEGWFDIEDSTVNNTPKTVGSYDVSVASPTKATIVFELSFLARDNTAEEGAYYKVLARFDWDGTTLTAGAAPTKVVEDEDDASWDVGFQISGSTVNIQVTGDATNVTAWGVYGTVRRHGFVP